MGLLDDVEAVRFLLQQRTWEWGYVMSRTADDDTLVAFACRWEPYGGADPSEIYVCFGFSVDEYRARLHSALTRSATPTVDPDVHQRLLRYCAI